MDKKIEQKLHYTACGLDDVFLLDGFHFTETKRGKILHIENVPGLHKAIGKFLIQQKRNLTGKELRFLRQELGLSQPNLANLLGESEQSVARREKRAWNKTTPQEKILRFMFEQHIGNSEPLREFLRQLSDLDELESQKLEFKQTSDSRDWQRAEELLAA